MRIGILIVLFLFSCSSEQKGIIYEFKLVNDSDKEYVVKRHYKYTSIESRTDTLLMGDEMVFSIPRGGNYSKGYGDSLINSFFDTLLVKMIDPERITYVYKRSLWKEEAQLDEHFLEKEGSMKGKVVYTLKLGSVVPSSSATPQSNQ